MAHAEAGQHSTVQNITSPWAGHSDLTHSNHFGAWAALTHVRVFSQSLTITTPSPWAFIIIAAIPYFCRSHLKHYIQPPQAPKS